MPEPAPAVWMPAVRCGTGADVFTERLAAALAERGIRCEVTWLPHRAEYAPWSVPVPSPPPWVNIVHINSWLPPRFVPDKLPLVVTVHHCVHDPDASKHANLAQRFYHRTLIRGREAHNIKMAVSVTAVSRFTARRVAEVFSVRQPEVIHNGIDTETFYPPSMKRNPHTPFRLLFVGSWTKRKGADLLSAIMAHLDDDFELICVSSPSFLQRLHIRPPPNARWLGPLSRQELVGAYRSADALLLPSRLEGFGLVACEAMACGTPVLASRCSSLPEIIDDGRTGILCEPDNPSAFATAARLLRDNPRLWKTLSEGATAHAHTCFQTRSMVDAYIALYRRSLPYASEHT